MAAPADSSISLRISVTNRCQLRCSYCSPQEWIEPPEHRDFLDFGEITSFVRALKRDFRLEKVRITGGEPLLRRNVEDLIAMISCLGVTDIAMTTNGQLLGDRATVLKKSGLNRVNISLDSLSSDGFHRLTGGGSLGKTLSGIEAALQCGLKPIKLNMVVMRGINDREVVDMVDFALRRGCEMRFLELMPIGIAAARFDALFISSEEVRTRLENALRLSPLPPVSGRTSSNYVVEDRSGRKGTVGFISPYSSPFCQGCHRLRLTADGHLIGCLARGIGAYIRPALGLTDSAAREALGPVVSCALEEKRDTHSFGCTQPMVAMGG